LKTFLLSIGSFLARLSAYLVTFGSLGLFILCLLDSTFVPLPSSADALLIVLSATSPHWMLFYVLIATLGSTIGCVILYYIARRAGSRALSRFSASKQKRVKDLIDRYDMLSVLAACLLPPPFPFKLVVITTGVLRINVVRFALAIFAGRAFRFLFLGYLAARYGQQAKGILTKYYPWIGLGLAVLIVAYVIVRALLKRRPPAVETLEAGN
jgi:membrane protein YqaA with SNARE-associated domain